MTNYNDGNWHGWNGGAFRVVKEHREPREFWVIPGDGKCFTEQPKTPYAIHVREVLSDA